MHHSRAYQMNTNGNYNCSSEWKFVVKKISKLSHVKIEEQNWSENSARKSVIFFSTKSFEMLMSPDSSMNSHQRKSPTLTMSSIVVQNQQSPASSMHQMRHQNRASSSMGDSDDGVSSATPSTHRTYIFMQQQQQQQHPQPQQHHTAAYQNIQQQQHNLACMQNRAKPPVHCPSTSLKNTDECIMRLEKYRRVDSAPEKVQTSVPMRSSNIEQTTTAAAGAAITTTSTTAATTTSIMQQRVHPQTNVIYKVSSRPLTPDYAKSYPVMDTTVASSVKGEPELNIGKKNP